MATPSKYYLIGGVDVTVTERQDATAFGFHNRSNGRTIVCDIAGLDHARALVTVLQNCAELTTVNVDELVATASMLDGLRLFDVAATVRAYLEVLGAHRPL